MVSNIKELSDIFSIFHDGSFAKHVNHSSYSLLYVDCMYLAERFDKDFDHFILKVYELKNIELRVWRREPEKDPYVIKDPEIVFQAPLDIYDSDIINNKLIIRVGQNDDSTLDYVGGELSFNCLGIEIYDPKLNRIDFLELIKICDEYWKDFANRK